MTGEEAAEEKVLTREEKIKFCMESAEQFGEGENDFDHWNNLNDKELDACVGWFDYLWTK